MTARCSHFGSSLAHGEIKDDCIRCPFHGWRYNNEGKCVSAGGHSDIPAWAGQERFPAEEHFGQLYFFLGPQPLFSFPTFENAEERKLIGGRPFKLRPQCSWFMVTANGFDIQHFHGSHDREVCGTVGISHPSPFAIRAEIPLTVAENSLFDRLVARVAGRRLRLVVSSWGGTLVLVEAIFPRAETFGLVSLNPLTENLTEHTNGVFVKRSSSFLARLLFDWLNAALRRLAIKRFVSADLLRMAGCSFSHNRSTSADEELRRYFHWAETLPTGREEKTVASV